MALFFFRTLNAKEYTSRGSMATTSETTRDPGRLTAAIWLVLKRYSAQLRKQPALTAGAIILPAMGDILTYYAPPLDHRAAARTGDTRRVARVRELAPYVAGFAGLWLGGQVCWRVAVALIARVEIRGLEALYTEAMDELLAKDLAFFQDNYAGSLTKRALGYARRFEDVST